MPAIQKTPTDDLVEIARTGGPTSPPAWGQFARPGYYVATHRIRPLIAQWILDFENENDAARVVEGNGDPGDSISRSVGSAGARATLAARAGVSVRLLHRILSGTVDPRGKNGSRYLTLDTVDRLFVGMDCVSLFYREPTNELQSDGFADVYFHPAVIGTTIADDLIERVAA